MELKIIKQIIEPKPTNHWYDRYLDYHKLFLLGDGNKFRFKHVYYLMRDSPLFNICHKLRTEAVWVQALVWSHLILVFLRSTAVNIVDLIQIMFHCPYDTNTHTHQKKKFKLDSQQKPLNCILFFSLTFSIMKVGRISLNYISLYRLVHVTHKNRLKKSPSLDSL